MKDVCVASMFVIFSVVWTVLGAVLSAGVHLTRQKWKPRCFQYLKKTPVHQLRLRDPKRLWKPHNTGNGNCRGANGARALKRVSFLVDIALKKTDGGCRSRSLKVVQKFAAQSNEEPESVRPVGTNF